MKNKTIQIAFLFAFSMLGSTYLTGAEWLMFFSYFGSWGTLGLIVACTLLTLLSFQFIQLARTYHIYSLSDFVNLATIPSLSGTFSVFLYTGLLCYGGFVIGSEATRLAHVLSIPSLLPCLIFIAFIFFLLKIRYERIWAMTVPLVAFALGIFSFLFFFEAHISIPSITYQLNLNWLWHAILFISFHFLIAIPMLLPSVAKIRDITVLSRGIYLGGALFTLISVLLHFVILSSWHDVHHVSEPLVSILSSSMIPYGSILLQIISIFQIILSITILFGGLIQPLSVQFELQRTPLQLLFLLITLLFSLLPAYFHWTVTSIYTILTYLGLILIVLLYTKRV